MHPVEWKVGESAGLVAACCLDRGVTPRAVRNTPDLLADFHAGLIAQGIELGRPEVTGY